MAKLSDPVTVTCYRSTESWDSREDALKFYMEGVMSCDGHERLRYENVVLDLLSGLNHATDHME